MSPKHRSATGLSTRVARVCLGIALASAPSLGAFATGDPVAVAEPINERHDEEDALERAAERTARRLLEDARRLEREGRLDAALRTTGRGLELAPRDPGLLRLQARLLDGAGRGDEADLLRARADALAPLSPDPPDTSLPAIEGRPAGTGLLVIVLPTPAVRRTGSTAGEARSDESGFARVIAERIGVRLPGARIATPPPGLERTVPDLAAWLDAAGEAVAISLRAERADCRDTIKDGRFGLAVLRVGSAPGVREVRSIREDEILDSTCPIRQIARVIEIALALPEFQRELEAAAARPPRRPTSRSAVHALFPELERATRAELSEGRRQLAAGRLEAARESFLRAVRIDPAHLDARSFLVEVERTLELSAEIARLRAAESAPGESNAAADRSGLEPHSTAAENRALEAQLAAEQSERDDLLASIALLASATSAPRGDRLAQLRDDVVPPDDALGVLRARVAASRRGDGDGDDPRSGIALVVRVLDGPDGGVHARYYFDAEALAAGPILVEEDSRGGTRLDRFVAWRDGRRLELWQSELGDGRPDVHIVYADDGVSFERIELSRADLREPLRVFLYRDGLLRSDFRDTDEDGRFDEILHFDADGSVALRERDSDRDGEVDTRMWLRGGQIVRRESRDADVTAGTP